MTAKQKKFAALAEPRNKITYADKIAGATKKTKAAAGKRIVKPKTKKKSGSKPKNPKLYARVKAEAKRKFKVYPSAYANAWLVRTYKKRGGTY
jgi:hypothetical protein